MPVLHLDHWTYHLPPARQQEPPDWHDDYQPERELADLLSEEATEPAEEDE